MNKWMLILRYGWLFVYVVSKMYTKIWVYAKASVGGFLSSPSNPRVQPWTGGENY
jgi:hypothetical protein